MILIDDIWCQTVELWLGARLAAAAMPVQCRISWRQFGGQTFESF